MVFGVSFWWILPVILLSVVMAWFKYRKLLRLPDIGRKLACFIAFLRFLTAFLLLFLLLQPALSLIRRVKVKPLLIIVQDNSASLLNNKDSLYYLNEYGASLREKTGLLEEKFRVEWLTFGKSVKKSDVIDFSENYTDIAGAFDYIKDNYIARKPEAVILLSDGIYNTGVNPRYKTWDYPVYTVGLGDTVQMPDVYVKSLDCNKFNFIRTVFPLKAEIVAVKQKGRTVKCVLRENGNSIREEVLTIDNDNYLREIIFPVEAVRKGMMKYTLSLETTFEERSLRNNLATAYVNIIDNSGEVIIWYDAPHPDIAAIAGALNTSGIFKCTVKRFGESLPAENKPSLFIFHNPRSDDPEYRKVLEMAGQRKTALWYILTGRKEITAFARYDKSYTANFTAEINEYASPALNRNFPFFEFTEEEARQFAAFPPVVAPFGELKGSGNKPLFFQKIKNTVLSNEMMSFYDRPDYRLAFFWGEGLWKWRLFSYKENGNHDLFNTLVYKTVNYLSGRRGNDRFLCDIESLYNETEDIVIHAELYNESYELVNTPDVRLVLRHDGKDFNYLMNRHGDKYRINLGNLPAGEYDYVFATDLKGGHFEKKGTFFIRTQNSEVHDVVADKALLSEIARHSGGQAVDLKEVDNLLQNINQNRNFKAEYKQEVRYVELGELQWLGLILIFLLCVEWFFLKYYAG